MKICVSGHRPSNNLSDVRWKNLKEKLKVLLIQHAPCEAISGMALGVDTVFAMAVIEFMADLADKVVAVWTGSSGGTKNCVDYAVAHKKEIIYIDPNTIGR